MNAGPKEMLFLIESKSDQNYRVINSGLKNTSDSDVERLYSAKCHRLTSCLKVKKGLSRIFLKCSNSHIVKNTPIKFKQFVGVSSMVTRSQMTKTSLIYAPPCLIMRLCCLESTRLFKQAHSIGFNKH